MLRLFRQNLSEMNRKFILQFYSDHLTKLSVFKEFKIMHSSNPILRTQSLGSYRKTIKHYSYFLTDKIGRGYSSTVYIGHNDYTGQKVAIKVIQLKFIKDLHAKRMLDNQLQCMSKVRHPRLLRLIDTYSTNNNIYIISEFCEGGDLQKQLKTKIKYSQSQLAYFMSQFYPAYLTLLEAGFIHRDLKPANILIKRNKIRIADFGIVKRTTQSAKDPYNIGTTAYMSPQSLYQNIFDQKTDVWSIGIMCYQLLHGRLPWKCESNNRQKLKHEILHTSISYDSSLISIDCILFLSQCLDRNPTARISIRQMMKNNWMEKMVAPLIKKQSDKRKKANSIMVNQKMERKQQVLPSNSFKKILTHEIITNEKDQTVANPELQFKQFYQKQENRIRENESPKRVPVYKFTYESRSNQNINNANIQMGVESTFQKMRLKIKGSLPSANNSQLLLNQTKSAHSSDRLLRLLIKYCRYLIKVMVNTELVQIKSLQEEDRKRLLDILSDEIIKRRGELQTIVETGQNIFHLQDWQAYKTSQQWISNRHQIVELIEKSNERMKNKKRSIKMENKNRLEQHFENEMRDGLCHIKNDAQAIIRQGKIDKNEELLSLMQLAEHFINLFQIQKIIRSYCSQNNNEYLLSYLDLGKQYYEDQLQESMTHNLSQFRLFIKDKGSQDGADLTIFWQELKCKLQALL